MNIGGLQPFTLSDFPGYPAAILFTQGCNFRCPYCHNRSLWDIKQEAADLREDRVCSFLKERIGRLDGVVITGGEPTLQPDLCVFARKLKKLGFKVKLDTNGSNPTLLKELTEQRLLDYIAMDIKAPEEKYHLACGLPVEFQKICQSIDIIASSGINHHFRTTFFKKLLDDDDMETIRANTPPRSRYVVQQYRRPPDWL